VSFTAPPGAQAFSESMLQRTRDLIDAGLWDIPLDRLVGWWGAFSNVEQRYFAACLLDSLIYRTPAQFASGILDLMRGGASQACSLALGLRSDLELVDRLRNRFEDPNVRLVPVICDSDPPSKSGPLVMRRLKKLLGVADKWMIWPWQIAEAVDEEGVKVILLIDDLLGSGKQVDTFCAKENVIAASKAAELIYAPVVAHQKGIDYLKVAVPRLKVVASEVLTDDHSFFSEHIWKNLTNGSIAAEDAKEFYLDLLSKTGFRPSPRVPALGVGELALCFGFSHGTPNNSLPLLWHASPQWRSLLER
jgi:hypothetical protein